MPALTANTIIQTAFQTLNVLMIGETPSPNDASFALGVLNRMVGGWSQRARLIPVVAREVFNLVANKGGPSNPYTIGSGGDFNTQKPPNQQALAGAALLLTDSDPDVEVPLSIYTDDAYQAVAIKELTSAQPTGIYYNPTYATDLGTINPWPVPDNATNDLVLYLQKALVRFTDLTTTYYMPEGYDDALVYNLSKRLAGPYGRTMTDTDMQLAVSALGVIERANTKLTDLRTDAVFWGTQRPYWFNIQTNSGG